MTTCWIGASDNDIDPLNWHPYMPRQRFSPQEVFIDQPATARFGRSISITSVAIELDQPFVADPEVMRDLMEHDVPDLAA